MRYLEMDGRREKGAKFGPWAKYLVYAMYFCLLNVQGHLRSFGAFLFYSDFGQLCVSKTAGSTTKRTTI